MSGRLWNGRGIITLRESLTDGRFIRTVGVYDGISAILAEHAGFEALWASGLCLSVSAGLPDAGLLTMTEFHEGAVRIRRSSGLPVIADVDSGFGDNNVIRRMVRLYESAGIDAVCIEDKQYPKRNSFRDGNVLEDPDVFVRRIESAKCSQQGTDFLVIGRLESLTVGSGLDDLVHRARRSRDAGADALLIHSRASSVTEVAQAYRTVREAGVDLPAFVVPTTYSRTTCDELAANGFCGAIFANQLLRAAVQSMARSLQVMADTGSSHGIESAIATVFDALRPSRHRSARGRREMGHARLAVDGLGERDAGMSEAPPGRSPLDTPLITPKGCRRRNRTAASAPSRRRGVRRRSHPDLELGVSS